MCVCVCVCVSASVNDFLIERVQLSLSAPLLFNYARALSQRTRARERALRSLNFVFAFGCDCAASAYVMNERHTAQSLWRRRWRRRCRRCRSFYYYDSCLAMAQGHAQWPPLPLYTHTLRRVCCRGDAAAPFIVVSLRLTPLSPARNVALLLFSFSLKPAWSFFFILFFVFALLLICFLFIIFHFGVLTLWQSQHARMHAQVCVYVCVSLSLYMWCMTVLRSRAGIGSRDLAFTVIEWGEHSLKKHMRVCVCVWECLLGPATCYA